MRSAAIIVLAFLTVLAGCDNQANPHFDNNAKAKSPRTVTLSADEIGRLGIETSQAQAAQYTPQIHGYGVVVNTTALAQQDAAIATAQAAQRQSQAALKRAQTLFGKNHAVSLEALETAERQAAADEAAVTLADRTEAAAFGERAPWRGTNRNNALLDKLTSGRAMLVETTFPLGVGLGALPSTLTITNLKAQSGHAGSAANIIWNAPADPTIPGRSFYALVNGGDFEQGEHVLVFSPTGKSIAGVRIPSMAIVLSEDKAWCYAAIAPRTFVRLLVDLSTPLADGYFVAQGISPGEPIAVKGTGLLLAREIGAAAAGYD